MYKVGTEDVLGLLHEKIWSFWIDGPESLPKMRGRLTMTFGTM